MKENNILNPCDPFVIYKVKNGFVLTEHNIQEAGYNPALSINNKYVFRNTQELCEWITEYYKEAPRHIEAV